MKKLIDRWKKLNLLIKISIIITAIIVFIAVVLIVGWNLLIGPLIDEKYNSSQGEGIDNSVISENLGNNEFIDVTPEHSIEDEDVFDETITPSSFESLKENIKNWANNGVAVEEDYVTNILVIGMENSNNSLYVDGRADAMMLFSINKKTETITMASILRDQYCYVFNSENKGYFTKLHHALPFYGVSAQIRMIESYYKIVIDNYVIVNFDSLTKIINAIGGVTVNVTNGEASYLRRCGWVNINGAGEYHFNGLEALMYMRIRKGNTGGDAGRAGRQRQVITQMIEQAQKCSFATLLSMAKQMIPNMRTGFTSTDLLAYLTAAFSENWFDYEIKQVSLPDSECAVGGINSEDHLWYWKTDFPLAAQKLQLALYGKTNIELEQNRKSWIK